LNEAAFTSEVELTNIVIKNTRDDLLVDIRIKNIFTEEMKKAVLAGITTSLIFKIYLNEVRDFWVDRKITKITAIHEIQYDALKKEFRIQRSWENREPLIVKKIEEARQLISEINAMKVIQLKRLKKGHHYQLKVKSELNDKKFLFFGLPWEFETDWYTINFIF
jgi:hypothetical protein